MVGKTILEYVLGAIVGLAFPAAVIAGVWGDALSACGGDLSSMCLFSAACIIAGGYAGFLIRGAVGRRRLRDAESDVERLREELLRVRGEKSEVMEERDFYRRNAMSLPDDAREDIDHAHECQRALRSLAMADNERSMHDIIMESVEGGTEDAVRYAAVIDDLVRYGCIEGVGVVRLGRSKPSVMFSGRLRVLRDEYPSQLERERADTRALIEATSEEVFRREIERIIALGRM